MIHAITFAVSTLEPSLHKGCDSPSVERLYSPLFVLNPKGTASCGLLHQSVVRWAESGGWFDEGAMSFLGCLILGPLPRPLFAGYVLKGFLLTLTIGLSCQTVDRLAFPHASLGQVRLDLATKLCVLYLCLFFKQPSFFPEHMVTKGSFTKCSQVWSRKKRKPQHPGFPCGPPPWY